METSNPKTVALSTHVNERKLVQNGYRKNGENGYVKYLKDGRFHATKDRHWSLHYDRPGSPKFHARYRHIIPKHLIELRYEAKRINATA